MLKMHRNEGANARTEGRAEAVVAHEPQILGAITWGNLVVYIDPPVDGQRPFGKPFPNISEDLVTFS